MRIRRVVLATTIMSVALAGCTSSGGVSNPDEAYIKLTQAGHPCNYEGFGETWLGCEHSTGGGRTYVGIMTDGSNSLREIYDQLPTWDKPPGCDRVDRPVILGNNWFAVEFNEADRAIILNTLGGVITTAGEAFGCTSSDAEAVQGTAEQTENENRELAQNVESELYDQAMESVRRQCETETGSSGATGAMSNCIGEKVSPCMSFDISCVVNKFFG